MALVRRVLGSPINLLVSATTGGASPSTHPVTRLLTMTPRSHRSTIMSGTTFVCSTRSPLIAPTCWASRGAGVIATRMTFRHPNRVRRLVLADTSRGSGRDADKAAAMRSRSTTLATEGAEKLAQSRSHRLLSPDAPADLVARVRRSMASSIRLPGYGQAAGSMADTDHTETLTSIDTPTLVVVGGLDTICPPAEAEQIVSLLPRAHLVVIDGAGHLANQERPDVFNTVIDNFLRRKDPEMSTDNPESPGETGELDEMIDSYLATRESRTEDWDTLSFQTKAGEQFRRAQVRYMGSGGTGRHEQGRTHHPGRSLHVLQHVSAARRRRP